MRVCLSECVFASGVNVIVLLLEFASVLLSEKDLEITEVHATVKRTSIAKCVGSMESLLLFWPVSENEYDFIAHLNRLPHIT